MNLDISNKYIYDACFMIYLSMFVAVVVAIIFSFCWCFKGLIRDSKDLIRDSHRLQFCNFVKLLEKAQNSII